MTTYSHLAASDLPETRQAGPLAVTLLTGALALSLAAFIVADLLAHQMQPGPDQPRRPVAASPLDQHSAVPALRADGPGVQEPQAPTF